MRKTFFTFLTLIALGAAGAGQAQQEKAVYTAAPKVTQPLPFKAGETLNYEVSFSKYIFSGIVGDLKLSVSKAGGGQKAEMIQLEAEVVSKGFFPKLFGIKVRDRFQAVINSSDFGLHSSTKLIKEGKLRREQRSVINREAGRVTYTERDLTDEKSQPRTKEAASPAWIQDILSACYFVRTQKLTEGDVIPIPVSDAAQVYNIEVVVGKREEVKTDAGKFKAVQLNAKVFDGRYVRRSGEMIIWMTDDARRIPVRGRIKTSGATVTIELKKMSQG